MIRRDSRWMGVPGGRCEGSAPKGARAGARRPGPKATRAASFVVPSGRRTRGPARAFTLTSAAGAANPRKGEALARGASVKRSPPRVPRSSRPRGGCASRSFAATLASIRQSEDLGRPPATRNARGGRTSATSDEEHPGAPAPGRSLHRGRRGGHRRVRELRRRRAVESESGGDGDRAREDQRDELRQRRPHSSAPRVM